MHHVVDLVMCTYFDGVFPEMCIGIYILIFCVDCLY